MGSSMSPVGGGECGAAGGGEGALGLLGPSWGAGAGEDVLDLGSAYLCIEEHAQSSDRCGPPQLTQRGGWGHAGSVTPSERHKAHY